MEDKLCAGFVDIGHFVDWKFHRLGELLQVSINAAAYLEGQELYTRESRAEHSLCEFVY